MKKKARIPVKTPALPVKARTLYRKVPIIVEGVDGSGKTTFCRWLVDELMTLGVNVEFCHHGPLRASVQEEYYDPLTVLSLYPTVLVADRWHIGEMIYGPLYRGKSEMSEHELGEIERLLDSLGAKKLLLDPPIMELKRRLADRGEDFLKIEDLNYVRYQYQTITWEYSYDMVRYATPSEAARIAKEAADECGRHTVQVR